MKKRILCTVIGLVAFELSAQNETIAKKWMDMMSYVSSLDGNGPTIQIRNIFHASAAMHDA